MRQLLVSSALAASLVFTGCSTVSTVDDNQDLVCGELDTLGPLVAGVTLNPEVSIAQNRADISTTLAASRATIASLNAAKRQLMATFEESLEEYDAALSTRDENSSVNDNLAGLDAYRSHVVFSYRSMLTNIGCPVPDIFTTLPQG